MLKGKVTFISITKGEFENKEKPGQMITFERANFSMENGDLVKDVRFDKGALDGIKPFETVTGYFRIDCNKKNQAVFAGYTR